MEGANQEVQELKQQVSETSAQLAELTAKFNSLGNSEPAETPSVNEQIVEHIAEAEDEMVELEASSDY
jgi:capsule polysaccharide export protein KpsE/RkpR